LPGLVDPDGPDRRPDVLQIVWLACAVVIITAALRAKANKQAAKTGRIAVAVLYLAAGALVNAALLAAGEHYADFADASYIPFVRDTWRDVVVPNHYLFIAMLIGFEAAVGVLVLHGGRRAQLGFVAAIAFHVALLSFGWGFYLWSIPMIGALGLLLRAERQPDRPPVRVVDATAAVSSGEGSIDLYWLPLGAGGHSVRFNGIIYEAISSLLRRRPRCDVYHSALQIRTSSGFFAVEMTPVPNRRSWERGVVAEGPVGMSWAGRLRIFRYEVRRWRDGRVPDLEYAVASPVRVADDPLLAQRVLELLPSIPTPTWGRDELQAGEMWSCNSITSWVLTRAGFDMEMIPFPPRARAPGWDAGITVARRGIQSERLLDVASTELRF